MTRFNRSLSLSALAVAGAIASMGLLSGTASADATSAMKNCKFNSHLKTVECCNLLVKQYGKPHWMLTSDSSCSTATTCSKYNRRTYCIIKAIQNTDDIGRGRGSNNNRRQGGKI